jgi:hypothetical protein
MICITAEKSSCALTVQLIEPTFPFAHGGDAARYRRRVAKYTP